MAKGDKNTKGGQPAQDNGQSGVVAVNKQAKREYEIVEEFEAGLVLLGSEIKSIRAGGAHIQDAYVHFRNGEALLVGSRITPYSHSRQDAHAPERERKLLLHRREIEKLATAVKQKGLSVIPIRMFLQRGRCKIALGLGRGKKLFDKREDVKRREAERQISRAMKRGG